MKDGSKFFRTRWVLVKVFKGKDHEQNVSEVTRAKSLFNRKGKNRHRGRKVGLKIQ